MPGITLIVNKYGEAGNPGNELIASLNEISIHKVLTSEKVYENAFYEIWLTKHPEYPVRIFNDEKYFIVIEGMIYNYSKGQILNAVYDELSLLNDASLSRKPSKHSLFSDADGEFIIFGHNKKNDHAVLVNDALVRLPLYVYNADKYTVANVPVHH
jgi:asparagine synthetase B (glutamine-hydrolysing)